MLELLGVLWWMRMSGEISSNVDEIVEFKMAFSGVSEITLEYKRNPGMVR